MTAEARPVAFYGWRVAGAAFIVAIFGWGLGFYGPPVYLHAVREMRGWSLALVSTAVTLHFLIGALAVANLPGLYCRFGVSAVTKAGALSLGGGVTGWAVAQEPWQLFAATLASGAGWAAMGAAAVNQIVSPWFVRARPAALSMAYNGASIGGVVFSPLWVAAIAFMSFPVAAPAIAVVTAVTIWLLADLMLSKTPQQLGLMPDGGAGGASAIPVTSPSAKPLPGSRLWCDLRIPDAGGGNGAGVVRSDRIDRASVLASGAGVRRPIGRSCNGGGNGRCDPRAHAGRVADAGRRRPAAGGMCQLRCSDRRLDRLSCGGRNERPIAVDWRHAVWGRYRKCNVIAATHRAGGIHRRKTSPASSLSSWPWRKALTPSRRLRSGSCAS